MKPLAALLAALLLPPAAAAGGPAPDAARARLHYVQHCIGCHHLDGTGAPDKGIPSMQGLLGRFAATAEGRAYIVQVPGVMNSPLNDTDIAALMNWLVPAMSGSGQARFGPPYTADEIARLRKTRPADVAAARRRLIDHLPPEEDPR